MKQYKFNMLNSDIHVFQFNPKTNPSQVVYKKDKRETMDNFKHSWFDQRNYKTVAKFNLGFFETSKLDSTHFGVVTTDHGFTYGYPSTNSYVMWLDNDGKLFVDRVKDRSELHTKVPWGISLANSLVLDGKENLGTTTGFNTAGITQRTAYGQRYDGDIVCVYASNINANNLAKVMVELDCRVAVLADGGGSSQYSIGGKVQRNTSRPLGTMLLVFDQNKQEVPVVDSKEYRKSTKNDNSTLPSNILYKVEITTSSLNIRNLPTTSGGNILGTYSLGEVADVYEESGIWQRTNKGWISSNYTKKKDEIIKKKDKYLIALDAGHSYSTVGKSVPQLQEHDFNSGVAEYAKKFLEHNGFDVLITQPLHSNIENSLEQRTNMAISNKVDALISVHADANDSATARGWWGFYWGYEPSKKLAETWLKNAKELFSHPERGIRESVQGEWTNFHMTRVPATNSTYKFPAILCEHAFMTNSEDLKLLLSEDFRKLCAKVLVKTMCEYFNKEFKEIEELDTNIDTQTRLGLEALEYLHKNKLIDTPDSWKGLMREQAENWLVFVLMKRLHEQLK